MTVYAEYVKSQEIDGGADEGKKDDKTDDKA